MWWKRLTESADALTKTLEVRHPTAQIAQSAVLEGMISVGEHSQICHGAYIKGPVVIGKNCLIGNNTMIRGPLTIGDGTKIGFGTELKNAFIGPGVMIGPQCFVADSVVDEGAYLGAMVRTSNHRLDGKNVTVMDSSGVSQDTGHEKLGCHIGARARLGIQVIIFPGRSVPEDSLFGPRINIEKNYPPGRYTLKQQLEVLAHSGTS